MRPRAVVPPALPCPPPPPPRPSASIPASAYLPWLPHRVAVTLLWLWGSGRGTDLDRRLSKRPSQEDLLSRNILHDGSEQGPNLSETRQRQSWPPCGPARRCCCCFVLDRGTPQLP